MAIIDVPFAYPARVIRPRRRAAEDIVLLDTHPVRVRSAAGAPMVARLRGHDCGSLRSNGSLHLAAHSALIKPDHKPCPISRAAGHPAPGPSPEQQ